MSRVRCWKCGAFPKKQPQSEAKLGEIVGAVAGQSICTGYLVVAPSTQATEVKVWTPVPKGATAEDLGRLFKEAWFSHRQMTPEETEHARVFWVAATSGKP